VRVLVVVMERVPVRVQESVQAARVEERIGAVEAEADENLLQNRSSQRLAGHMGSRRDILDMVEGMVCSDHFQPSPDSRFAVT